MTRKNQLIRSHLTPAPLRRFKEKTLLILISCTFFFNLQGQELISTAGTHFTNSTYQLSWSLGEVVITTETNSNFSIFQGFHVPFNNTLELTSLNSEESIQVYPNPATQEIFISAPGIQNSSIEIYDSLGKKIVSSTIENEFGRIDLTSIASGIYFLRVNDQLNSLTTKFYKL